MLARRELHVRRAGGRRSPPSLVCRPDRSPYLPHAVGMLRTSSKTRRTRYEHHPHHQHTAYTTQPGSRHGRHCRPRLTVPGRCVLACRTSTCTARSSPTCAAACPRRSSPMARSSQRSWQNQVSARARPPPRLALFCVLRLLASPHACSTASDGTPAVSSAGGDGPDSGHGGGAYSRLENELEETQRQIDEAKAKAEAGRRRRPMSAPWRARKDKPPQEYSGWD